MKRNKSTVIATYVICMVFLPGRASRVEAQCERAKLSASDPCGFVSFGVSVDISGDFIVVGTRHTITVGSHGNPCPDPSCRCGAAYVFQRDGTSWTEVAKLIGSDTVVEDFFGEAVAISGDVVVVGTPDDEDFGGFPGAAYVFRRDGATWVQEAKLSAGDPLPWAGFGSSVSIEGELIVVGAPHAEHMGVDSGAVYVFRHEGAAWIEEDKLVPLDGGSNDRFGRPLSVSGDLLAVGAPRHDHGAILNSGAAYLFRRQGTTWVQEAELLASNAAEGDAFGSVSISGEVVAVGAGGANDDVAPNAGAVYVFRHDGTSWIEEAWLTPSDPGSWQLFGISVSSKPNVIVVGSWADGAAPNAGAVYIFSRRGGTWTEQAKITASDGAESDWFGRNSMDGDYLVVGARGDDHGTALDSGSAYVFAVSDCLPLVPTVSEWGVVIMSLLVLAGGTIVIARKKVSGVDSRWVLSVR